MTAPEPVIPISQHLEENARRISPKKTLAKLPVREARIIAGLGVASGLRGSG